MISTNFFPKEPVPPVTRTTCSDQFIPCASPTFVWFDPFAPEAEPNLF
jgi:hypothetical protein